MKHLFTLSLCLFGLISFGQNNTPAINIISVEADELTEELSVTYQLQDADADDCEVWLKFSEDGGTYSKLLLRESYRAMWVRAFRQMMN